MEKTYNPQAIEQHWYHCWEKENYFAPRGTGKPYSIMIPPPNITGSLHMGHAFQDTVMDILIRYHRMQGHNTLWQAGTDHAGIATQMVVERQLAAEHKTRHDLGREKFTERVWDWKKQSGGTITQQLRRLGASLDWSRERFTMDDGLSEAVQQVFIQLYQENLIYRGKRLVNWDPVLHTAVSDLEVLSQEEKGFLWYFRYPLEDNSGHLVVATTRPETMLGDMAVAVHPEDERYRHYIGKQIRLPLTERTIPIIADEHVDPQFGTGCVKITPAHDFNDYDIGKRHQLPMMNIFTANACLNENVPANLQGMDRYDARQKIVELMEQQELLEKIDDHTLMVPRGDRSGAVVEPYLTDQWYVKVAPLAKPAIEAVKNGDIQFVPDNWKNTYFDWMNNIEDWCISRQIWWGHRIPAWYDPQGNVYVGTNESEIRQKYSLGNDIQLSQDEDVLDTWFSAALWPFSTLGWPHETADLKTFYPTSVLVTGFDIIFFWVARMIMMGLKFTGKAPFKQIYIHGLVRDSHGQKMSKSKGNVLDPIDLIDGISLEALLEKRAKGLMQPQMAQKIEQSTQADYPNGVPAFGTDALRFTYAALASTGRNINFDLNRIEGYRNFCNKLWNAARYVLMNTEHQDCGQHAGEQQLSLADRWIIGRLQNTIQQSTHAISQYRFDHMAQAIYEFVWHEYCDWYLELCKVVLQDEQSSDAEKRGTRHTLVNVLDALLRLSHPIIPYITEEIWQKVAPLANCSGNTIMHQAYPNDDPSCIDSKAIEELEWVKKVILGVRKIRSGMDIPPGKPLPMLLQNFSQQDQQYLTNNQQYLMRLAKLQSIDCIEEANAPESATALVGNMKVLIPLAGLIDKQAELDRLSKEIEKMSKTLNACQHKLNNKNFVDRAPAIIVEKENTRLEEIQSALNNLNEQRTKIEGM